MYRDMIFNRIYWSDPRDSRLPVLLRNLVSRLVATLRSTAMLLRSLGSTRSRVLDALILVAVGLARPLLVVVRLPVRRLDHGLLGVGSLGDVLLALRGRKDPRALDVGRGDFVQRREPGLDVLTVRIVL